MPRNTLLEKKLKTLYECEFEVNEPYEGKHGKYPAEVFCIHGHLREIVTLLTELHLEQDIIASDCGMRGGNIQVIIKTQDALAAFKKAINEKIIQTPMYQISQMFFADDKNEKGKTNKLSDASDDIDYTIAKVFNYNS